MRQRAWGPKTNGSAWCPDKYVKWAKTKKAWMDKEVFNAWLKDVWEEFTRQRRTVFMIMDNAPSHTILGP